MSIKITLETIFGKIGGLNKSRKKFLIELFELLPSIRGRMNFVNMARYSHYNELTFRRQFKELMLRRKLFFVLSTLFLLVEKSLKMLPVLNSFQY